MEVLAYGISVAVVALAAWIYFDAWDRGFRYPWLWALVVLLAWPSIVVPAVVVIAYISTRKTRPHLEVAPASALRLYLVVTCLTALTLAVSGASTGFWALLSVATGHSSVSYRNLLAASLSAAIVGGGVWAVHWIAVRRYTESLTDDQAFRAMYRLRRIGIITAGFIFGGITAAAALSFFTMAVGAIVHASWGAASWWVPLIGPLVAAGSAAAFHGLAFRRELHGAADERWRTVPPPLLVRGGPGQRQLAYPPSWADAASGAAAATASSWPSPAPEGASVGETPIAESEVPDVAAPVVGSSVTAGSVAEGWWLASDGHWYPPPASEWSPEVAPEGGDVAVSPDGQGSRCVSCGTDRMADDRFCRSCGAPLLSIEVPAGRYEDGELAGAR